MESFRTFFEETNVVIALVVSVALFAYVWPVFNGGTALLLGLANSLLYRRFRNVLPGIAASALLTLLATVTLVWRLFVKG